jgi:hypothetical protein
MRFESLYHAHSRPRSVRRQALRTTTLLLALAATLAVGAAAAQTPETRLIANVAERGNSGAQVLLALDFLHGSGGVARDDTSRA